MTDALVEEIYALAREAFRGGQQSFQVHAFPFRMTNEKLARYRNHQWYHFWTTLKQGYDTFELTRVPPTVAVCERRYVVNVELPAAGRIDPERRCPAFRRPLLEPFAPRPEEQQIAEERITVSGPKIRDVASITVTPGVPEQSAQNMSTGSTLPAGISALGFKQ